MGKLIQGQLLQGTTPNMFWKLVKNLSVGGVVVVVGFNAITMNNVGSCSTMLEKKFYYGLTFNFG